MRSPRPTPSCLPGSRVAPSGRRWQSKLIFRPLMLSNPIEEVADRSNPWPERDRSGMEMGRRARADRGQRRARQALFSRSGDDISDAFPEIVSAYRARRSGARRRAAGGAQRRDRAVQRPAAALNRKNVTPRMMKEHPAFVRLYDLLFDGGEDLRPLPFTARRARLERWFAREKPLLSALSDLIPFKNFAELEAIWANTRERRHRGPDAETQVEPLPRGPRQGPLVEMEALRAHARLRPDVRAARLRQALVLLFGLYLRRVARTATEGPELVPVGKAYSGFTDEELHRLDRFVRNNTIETFGPVRAVEPQARARGGLRCGVSLDAPQVGRRHALSARSIASAGTSRRQRPIRWRP